jgi:hypothetical protein
VKLRAPAKVTGMSEIEIQQYSDDDLRKLTEQAREDLFNFLRKIEILWQEKADVRLGYGDRDHGSWQKYMQSEFTSLPRIKRAERKPLSTRLSELGMSTRDVAATTGVHKDTVRNDLAGEKSPTRSSNKVSDQQEEIIVDAEIIEDSDLGKNLYQKVQKLNRQNPMPAVQDTAEDAAKWIPALMEAVNADMDAVADWQEIGRELTKDMLREELTILRNKITKIEETL